MTETITLPSPQPISPNPLHATAPVTMEAESHIQARSSEAGEEPHGTNGSAPPISEGMPVAGVGESVSESVDSEAGASGMRNPKIQRSRKRSTRHLEELQRRQADLVKPEKKTEPIPGTRLEPSLSARWESAVKDSGLSSSGLVYVAVVEYLESVEQRSILGQMQGVARLVADTGNALLGSMDEVRARLASLDSVAAQLKETVELQEARFITAEDVEGMLDRMLSGADEESDADEQDTQPEGAQ
ncbi:hypothetical protein [Scleromatobacter humisilvae]|uniref:Uncharacterized protein n=1 Tax=Scleromatobacter humisilvae TaxID=2897159 RepID=A0A9X1YM55_9BURK|nr:hypothetical protein [Scleromatobacter humisilvae]MCK9687268.1 hypothetical protein [Scleromatobacter humisilvae]